VTADAAYWEWFVTSYVEMSTGLQGWTASKKALRDDTAGPSPHPTPAAPVPGPAPTSVAPGIFPRIRALVKRFKTAPGYTVAIGEDLGVEDPEIIIDHASWKPVLQTRLVNGGQVEVVWRKLESDGIELQVDRGAGWVFLAIDTEPNYTDTAPLPAPGQSAVWQYRGIYRLGDERVGQWSDPVSQAVMG
jgi:hypothetical protein